MATIFRCDRCHSDFRERDEIKTIELPHVDKWFKFTEEEYRYNRELCASCWRFILEHVKELPKQGII